MRLIDIYIQEVTRRLPEKNREDIALELRSTIEDMLPEKYTEVEVKEVLAKLGSPATLASGYLDRPMHLIGPRYFDLYVTLLKIIIPIVAVVLLIVVIAENIFSYSGEQEAISTLIIGKGITEAFSASLQLFFWITLVFAILERTDKSKEESPLTINFKKWTPADLNNIPYKLEGKSISKMDIFASIFGIAIFIAVYFNAEKLLRVYETVNGKLQMVVPLFNQEVLQSYWVIVLIAIGLEITLVFYKFIVGQWTTRVAKLNLVRNIVTSTVFIIIFSNSNVIESGFFKFIEDLFDTSLELESNSISVLIILFVIFAVIDVIQGFRKANIKK